MLTLSLVYSLAPIKKFIYYENFFILFLYSNKLAKKQEKFNLILFKFFKLLIFKFNRIKMAMVNSPHKELHLEIVNRRFLIILK